MSYGLTHFAGSAGVHAGGRLPDPLWTPGGYTIFDRQGNLSPLVQSGATSMGWLFDQTGTLKARPHNLLLWSAQFDNAAWAKSQASVTPNVTAAPDGFQTADKFFEDTNTGEHRIRQNVTVGVGSRATISCYVKASERSSIRLRVLDAAATSNGFFASTSSLTGNTAQGVIGTAVISSVQSESVGNGWYRFHVTGIASPTASNLICDLFVLSGNETVPSAHQGDGTSGIFIWGAQLNQGELQPYNPTTGAAYYGPRASRDPLNPAAEPFVISRTARTNSGRNNTMIGATVGEAGVLPSGWATPNTAGLLATPVAVGQINGMPSVDVWLRGTANSTAWTLTFDALNATAAAIGQQWSASVFWQVVSGTLSGITAAHQDIRELDSAGSQVLSGTLPIEMPVASLRRAITHRVTAATNCAFVQPRIRLSVTSGAAINVVLRIVVPELSQGEIFPWEPPILTYGAPVTVNADFPLANVTGLVPAGGYTLYADCDDAVALTGATRRYVQLDDSTASNRVLMGRSAPTVSRLLVQNNNAAVADLVATVPSGGRIKSAARVRANDFRQATNRVLSPAGVNGSPPSVTWLRLGSDVGGEVTVLGTRIYNAGILPALPDATLQRLTC